jgi:hypothetical protein
LLLAALVIAGMVGLALAGSQSSAQGAAKHAASAARERSDKLLQGAELVPSLATDTSETYRRPDGRFVTRIFSQPADADASLQRATGGGYDAHGHGASTHFPQSLAEPLTFTSGGARVTMRLVGGAGTASANGSTITYAGALPGVAVQYRSSEGAIGEDLHLTGSDAPSRYVFELRTGAGLHAATRPNGTIALTDAGGKQVLALSPSYAFADRAPTKTQKVATSLAPLGDDAWRVTLTVDGAWLRGALAGGPVTIDPTVELQGATKDCALSSDAPTMSFCSDHGLWVGWSGDHDHHSLVKWDVGAIPKDALVLSGDVGLYQSGSTVPVDKTLTVHRLTRDWTNGASWNTYDGTHAWTTPGGDFDPTPAASQNDPADNDGWVDWYPTALVQHWVDGALPNYGVLVKDQSPPHVVGEEDFGSTEGMNAVTAPELDVIWTTRGGAADAYTFESQAIDAKTSAAVNAANGNLQLTTRDVAIAGPGGLDLAFNHYYNSIADPTVIGGAGLQTTGSFGRDVALRPLYGGDLAFSRGDGLTVAFSNPQTSGTTTTFTTPADLPGATLTQATDTGRYTLDLPSGLPAWPTLHLILTFDADGKVSTIADSDGDDLSLSYYDSGYTDPPSVGGIIDANGDYYDIDRSSDGEESVDNIADPADANHWTFAYDSVSGTLTDATSIDATRYHYNYDSRRRLAKITGPTGAVTLVTYNGTTPQVASIIQTTNAAHTTGPTTTFTYSSPTAPCQSANFDYTKTVVHRPDNTSTTYCANDHAQLTYDTDNPTSATPSGTWYDLRDQYTNGAGSPTVALAGRDAGAGVATMTVEEVGGATVATYAVPCNPRNAITPVACPHDATGTTAVAASGLAEGAHRFRERATDFAGNAKVSDPWTVTVDKTAPSGATGFDAQRDPDEDVTYLDWDPGTDPALPDGSPGSGVGDEHVRFQRSDGAWSAWRNATTTDAEAHGFAVGDTINVETYGTDRAGNTSVTVSAQVPVTAMQSENDDWAAVWDDGSSASRQSLAGLKKNQCPMSGINAKLTERSDEDRVNVQAFGNFGCPADPGFQYMQVTACVTYLDDDARWHPVIADESDADDEDGCVSKRGHTNQPPVLAEVNALCRPGTHDYRVTLHGKVALHFPERDIHVKKVLNSSDLDCNESGAWRVLANENVSSPSTTLGRALNGARNRAPGNGFAAHHIVPASYASRASEAQRIAYACGFLPNSADNGAWLRGSTLKKRGEGRPPVTTDSAAYDALDGDGRRRAYHPSIHTNLHFDWVANQFKTGGTYFGNAQCHNTSADGILRSIRTDLEYDDAPFKPGDTDPLDPRD